MKQLTGLDAIFLALDSGTVCSHLGCVAVLDPPVRGPALTTRRLAEIITARLHVAPPFRRRLVEVPFGLDQPYWMEDPNFDIEHHIGELELPAPGDDGQLAAATARLHEQPLDRSRPLWEMRLIHGLTGGRKALYTKVHHAAIDGVAGSNLLAALVDTSAIPPTEIPEIPWHPDPLPSTARLLGSSAISAAGRPLRCARLTAEVLRSLPALATGPGRPRLPVIDLLLPRRGSGAVSAPLIAPATPFNKMLGPLRRCAFGSLPLTTVNRIRNSVGATVNDVVMALCAGALRRWLRDHDGLPTGPLLAAVPVNIRGRDDSGTEGNRLAKVIAALPTHLERPDQRLRATREAMATAKAQFSAIRPDLLTEIAQLAIPALAAPATRFATRVRLLERVRPLNLFISNVPGPAVDVYLGGARLHAAYPISTIADGQGLNITVLGSRGKLNVGVVADADLLPDPGAIMAALAEELALLEAGVDRMRPDRSKSEAVGSHSDQPCLSHRRAAGAQ
ncbi:MAG: wax ester/triacylglycerol synthase family O-acyltransferase [Mycobacterium sp.]|nr:wax ester/triacylglycerol synthase family O-acyltransferase [Mycobacterium sp.]